MSATIIQGNALKLPLADASVDLIVTSPPYFGLRSYQDGGEHYSGQIGSEATATEFLDALISATREMARVLKNSGSIFVNLGDKYDKDKSLMDLPHRYAIRVRDELRLIKRAEICWSKPNGLPESVTDRVRRSHEFFFHFTKEPRYYSAVDEIREEYAPDTAKRYEGGYAHSKTAGARMSTNVDYSGTIYATNPLGKLPGSVWTIPTQPLKVPPELGIDHFAAFPMEWPRRIIAGWSPAGVCTACGQGRRPVKGGGGLNADGAALLAERGVHSDHYLVETRGRMGETRSIGYNISGTERAKYAEPVTITGYACDCAEPTAPTTPGVVLDPFGGTGTTALVADVMGRRGISVDMSADYCRLAAWRASDGKQRNKAAGLKLKPKTLPKVKNQDGLDLFAWVTDL